MRRAYPSGYKSLDEFLNSQPDEAKPRKKKYELKLYQDRQKSIIDSWETVQIFKKRFWMFVQ